MLIFLWTDILIWSLLLLWVGLLFKSRKKPYFSDALAQLVDSKIFIITAVVLMTYLSLALLDSIHYQPQIDNHKQKHQQEQQLQLEGQVDKVDVDKVNHGDVHSFLDYILQPWSELTETTFSSPFSDVSYVKDKVTDASGMVNYMYPALLKVNSISDQNLIFIILAIIFFASIGCGILYKVTSAKSNGLHLKTLWLSVFVVGSSLAVLLVFYRYFHILGTDKIGQDIFYVTVKAIRTGVLIGSLTTIFMLPLAIFFGTIAGYYGGRCDDIIQYLYTTLSSIPGVLLIAAFILITQTQLALHPDWFVTIAEQADIRLLALCFILGITSWSGLCRLLRAETLKIRELDYVTAAKTMRVSNFKIIIRHVIPNLAHIIVISVAIDFSSLVLAEAVLSYIGVGVDPTTMSWGNMINSARLELAREPIVWWPILGAFIPMFVFVLSLNLFAERVRDAFDPRIR